MINKQTPCMTYTYIVRGPIIPVHNILDQFISCSCEIGKRNPIKCMAVIPLGKKFHM